MLTVFTVAGYKEGNEELQAALVTKSLEEGRTLLNDTHDRSLAAEFDAMSENEVSECNLLILNCNFWHFSRLVAHKHTSYKL